MEMIAEGNDEESGDEDDPGEYSFVSGNAEIPESDSSCIRKKDYLPY